MKESIIISILIIIIYIFFFSNKSDLLLIETHDTKVFVRDMADSNVSAILLTKLVNIMYSLRDYLVDNTDRYYDYMDYINLMKNNFNKTRTRIYENKTNSNFTSYSVNKGEEIVFCLRCKETHLLHDINVLVYVAIHEMAHTACPEIGHTDLFNKIFKFLLEIAVILSLYKYEDYSNYPVQYCGMKLHSNILN